MEKFCSMCGGLLGFLGTLGRLDWWVCRDCGMQFSCDHDEERDGLNEY